MHFAVQQIFHKYDSILLHLGEYAQMLTVAEHSSKPRNNALCTVVLQKLRKARSDVSTKKNIANRIKNY